MDGPAPRALNCSHGVANGEKGGEPAVIREGQFQTAPDSVSVMRRDRRAVVWPSHHQGPQHPEECGDRTEAKARHDRPPEPRPPQRV